MSESRRLAHLRHGLLVLDLPRAEQSQHVLGALGHGVLHAVVVPQLFHAQLHPTHVRLTCGRRQRVSNVGAHGDGRGEDSENSL